MQHRGVLSCLLVWLFLLVPAAARAQEPIVLDGEVPDDGSSYLMLPFTVPEGTQEIEVSHDDMSEMNILDWGLHDPAGFRGWGGGNTEPAIVGVMAASRSYLAGPIPAGEWQVEIGKARILERPARYHVEIVLRTAPTLAPQPERTPYVPAAALSTGPRWYAGDFHVHSRESGDARPPLDEIATFARSRGLDFVELSDHNTHSQLDFIVDAQSRAPELLFLPGVEWTSYRGHANGIGATEHVDQRVGEPGVTIESVARAYGAQGAVFAINHPSLITSNSCLGCGWAYTDEELPAELIGAIEIGVGGWDATGSLFDGEAIMRWDGLLDRGLEVTPIGGSDDHRAGVDLGMFQSPIGSPTTMVYATELSAAAIVDGVRQGRTVVKLKAPDDPMIDLVAGDQRVGDTIAERTATLEVTVTGATGIAAELVFVRNGIPETDTIAVDADPFMATREIQAPPGMVADRWRAEIWIDGDVRVVTSHLWVEATGEPPPPDAGSGGTDAGTAPPATGGDDGCGCRAAGAAGVPLRVPYIVAILALGLLGVAARWRRRTRHSR